MSPSSSRTALSMPLIGGLLRACACKHYIFKADYYGIVLSVKQHKVNSVSVITLSPWNSKHLLMPPPKNLNNYIKSATISRLLASKSRLRKSLVRGSPRDGSTAAEYFRV